MSASLEELLLTALCQRLFSLIQVLAVACDALAGQEILMPPFVLTDLIGLNLKMQERCLLHSPSESSFHELGMS